MGFKSKKHDLTRIKPLGTQPIRSRCITLVIIPDDLGTSRKITLPKSILWVLCTLTFGFASAGLFAGYRYFELIGVQEELNRIQAEHESIRNEATALYSQLLDVQNNLNQVDSFSNQVREATKLEDGEREDTKETAKEAVKKIKKTTSSISPRPFATQLERLAQASAQQFNLSIPASEGIGPISRDEFEKHVNQREVPQNLSVPAKVRSTSLEFANIFSELANVKEQSNDQITDLTTLLDEVQQYRIRIDQTPTLPPVEGRLTSAFGFRQSPFSGNFRMHNGLDIAAPLGSPIRAAAAGVVLKVGRAADYGKFVKLQHAHDVVTVYAHAQRLLVKKGDVVHKGQTIALVGMTGRTTGPHLHYEVRVNNRRVNPKKYLSFHQAE